MFSATLEKVQVCPRPLHSCPAVPAGRVHSLHPSRDEWDGILFSPGDLCPCSPVAFHTAHSTHSHLLSSQGGVCLGAACTLWDSLKNASSVSSCPRHRGPQGPGLQGRPHIGQATSLMKATSILGPLLSGIDNTHLAGESRI